MRTMKGEELESKKRRYPSRPLVGVGAIAVKEGKILLVKRAFEPGAGKWSIPGGMVEIGETMAEACTREMEEETGLAVEVLEQIRAFDMVDKDDEGKVRYHYVLIDFLVKPTGGTLKPNVEVLETKWATYDEARAMDLTNTARKALTELFGGA